MANPTVPSPATWASGPVLVPALRNDVANAVGFLSGPPLFTGQNSVALSIPNAANSAITLDTDVVDTWNGHAQGVSNYVCQAPGWHIVTVGTQFSYSGTTTHNFTASVGTGTGAGGPTVFQGEQVGGGSGQFPGPCAADLVPLINVGSDYVQANCRQDTGGALNLVALPYLSVRWVAAMSGTAGLTVPANPAWPVPPSYVTSAFLNSNIRDTINFLAYPPIFRGYYAGSGASVPSQTFPAFTAVNLDTVSGTGTAAGGTPVDNYSGWSSSGHYWTAPVAGLYSCYGQVALATNAAAYQLSAGFAVNGTVQWTKSAFQPISTVPRSALAAKKIRLNAGDQVQLAACQTTGSSLGVEGSSGSACFSKMIIVWEAA